jgi:hypothetical protein
MIEYLEKHEDLQAVLDAAMLSPVDTYMIANNVMVKGLASVVTISHHLAFQGHKLMKDCRKTMSYQEIEASAESLYVHPSPLKSEFNIMYIIRGWLSLMES